LPKRCKILGSRHFHAVRQPHHADFRRAAIDHIRLIHARHERLRHMADAWGRLPANPGRTGDRRSGHSNAVAALYTALASESPLVLLSGHAPWSELGRGAFQEMAQADSRAGDQSVLDGQALRHGFGYRQGNRTRDHGRPGPVQSAFRRFLEQTIADEQLTRITKGSFSS